VGAQTGNSLPFTTGTLSLLMERTAGTVYQLSKPIQLRAGGFWTHQVLPASEARSPSDSRRWGASLGITLVAATIVLYARKLPQ